MAKMNLLLLIERLEELVNSNFQIAGKVLIDREEMDELIHKIQIALPEEIKQAQWVSREQERYLHQAHEEAEKIIKEAEIYAKELIRQDQILTKAEEEAGRIIQVAKYTAEEIRSEACEYAKNLFDRMEDNLNRALTIVREGRDEIDTAGQ